MSTKQRSPQKTKRKRATADVVVGLLAGFTDDHAPLVDFSDNPTRRLVAARTIATCGPDDVGREVVLSFDQGRLDRPIIMGLLQPAAKSIEGAKCVKTEQDGRRLVLTADREIVLQCGEASLTLTRAGKVVLRGAYVLSRSSGVNRVQGASVQIN